MENTENSFRVRLLRTTMGLTHAKFGEAIGLRQPAISKIESGMISGDDHMHKIESIWRAWKEKKIESLKKQIKYLESL